MLFDDLDNLAVFLLDDVNAMLEVVDAISSDVEDLTILIVRLHCGNACRCDIIDNLREVLPIRSSHVCFLTASWHV